MTSHLQYYPSNIGGTTIVNAVSGKPYTGCYVSSFHEKQFFKVIDVSGYYNTAGTKTLGNNIPNKLFYDNYAQYKKHRCPCEINDEDFISTEDDNDDNDDNTENTE